MRFTRRVAIVAVLVSAVGAAVVAAPASAAGCTVTVSGTVVDAVTGAGQARSEVSVIKSDGSEYFNAPYRTFTDVAGRYSLPVPCRDADAVVRAAPWAPGPYAPVQYGPHATDVEQARAFSLRQAGAVEQDVLLTPGAHLVSVSPKRVIDTRTDGRGPLGPRERRAFALTGVPADATAVVLNLTTTQGTSATSFVSVIADDGPPGTPTTSAVNSQLGRDIANLVTVGVAPRAVTGRATPQVTLYNNAGSMHLVADLAGYYVPDGAAGFVAIDPERVLDTRESTAVAAGATRTVPLGSAGRAPEGAVAAMVTVTTTWASAGTSYVSAFPSGAPDGPSTSVVNAYRGDDIANLAIVRLGDDGDIDVYNDRGTTHVVVDVVGWFVEGHGSLFFALDPKRSWQDVYSSDAPHQYGINEFMVSPFADAVLLNVTTYGATRPSYLSVYRYSGTRPATSAVNARPGNHVAAAVLAPGTSVRFYNSGDTRGLVDVTGFFSPRDLP